MHNKNCQPGFGLFVHWHTPPACSFAKKNFSGHEGTNHSEDDFSAFAQLNSYFKLQRLKTERTNTHMISGNGKVGLHALLHLIASLVLVYSFWPVNILIWCLEEICLSYNFPQQREGLVSKMTVAMMSLFSGSKSKLCRQDLATYLTVGNCTVCSTPSPGSNLCHFSHP